MKLNFFLICLFIFISNVTSIFNPLQVRCEVNGKILNAIIDTGAEVTVMSASCAKKCNIYSKIDTEKKGKAIGIGSSLILGRTNKLNMRIGPLSFLNKISVLSSSRCDLLIGLDILKRFNCEINIKENFIKFFVRGEEVRIPLDNKSHKNINDINLDSKNLLTDYLQENFSVNDDQNEIFEEELDSYNSNIKNKNEIEEENVAESIQEESSALFSSTKYRSMVNAANRLINDRSNIPPSSSQNNYRNIKALRVNHFHLDNESQQFSMSSTKENFDSTSFINEESNINNENLNNDATNCNSMCNSESFYDENEDDDFFYDPNISMEGV